MEPITATAIAAGAQLTGQAINAMSQGSMNKKTREWNERMYAKQRADSLADYTMQNQYNSPAEQMKRLKMAGLNPNLVYGKGADNIGGVVRSSDTGSWNPQAPKFELGAAAQTGLSAYYNVQTQQAQIDNLKAQNNVLVNEAALKSAQIASTLQGTETSKFDLGLKSELRQVSLQAATEGLRKLTTDIDISMRADERAAASTAMSLTTAVENILSLREQRAKTIVEKEQIRKQIENLKSDNELKRLDLNLKRIGVQPGDNILLRAAGQFISKNPIGELYDKGKNWLKSKFK